VRDNGQYYLHRNGLLIYKPHSGVEKDAHLGGVVIEVWGVNEVKETPSAFVAFLREAKHLGAKTAEIERLAAQNKLAEYIPGWRELLGGASS